MDKFAAYYNNEDRIQELSDYVHENMKLILTKMASEMRRKLNITSDLSNSDGYVSLIVSLYGRMFNEFVYGLAANCQSFKMKLTDIVPHLTIEILFQLIRGENPLNGKIRTDVKFDLEGFKRYYESQIDDLRKELRALPK